MFSQIFLGLYWLFAALMDWFQKPFMLSKKAKERANISYFRLLSLTHGLIGMLFIAMGIVEKLAIFSAVCFVLLYIALACIPLTLMMYNNKKHFGKIIIRD